MAGEPGIGFNISWIARMMRTRFDARARGIGLTRAQWRMIATIHLSEGATQSDIASQLEINSVTAGRIIDRLEAAGLIERRADPVDRRANRLYLTPAATPMLTVLGGLGEEEESAALDGLSDEERRSLGRLLSRVADNLFKAPAICPPVNASPEDVADVRREPIDRSAVIDVLD